MGRHVLLWRDRIRSDDIVYENLPRATDLIARRWHSAMISFGSSTDDRASTWESQQSRAKPPPATSKTRAKHAFRERDVAVRNKFPHRRDI
jgi:hypothetical protein